MRSKFWPQLLQVLGLLLLAVPLLLVGWFIPDALFLGISDKRRKPMSAEAKFLWLVFAILLVIGAGGWWLWHRLSSQS